MGQCDNIRLTNFASSQEEEGDNLETCITKSIEHCLRVCIYI